MDAGEVLSAAHTSQYQKKKKTKKWEKDLVLLFIMLTAPTVSLFTLCPMTQKLGR